jgi:hypothetical protein
MRPLSQHFALLLSLAALGATGARASDIQCASTERVAERVICDHAILNNEYDSIYEKQQSLLQAGRLKSEDLVDWKQLRDACTDVQCIDGVFTQWKSMAKKMETGVFQPPQPVPATPAPDAPPSPALQVSPLSESSQVRQDASADVSLPQPIEQQGSTVVTPPAASDAPNTRTSGISGALITVILVVLGLGVLIGRGRTANARGSTGARTSRGDTLGSKSARDSAPATREKPSAARAKEPPKPKPPTLDVLRDSKGLTMGSIRTLDSGKLELRDAQNLLVGHYDPRYNETRSRDGRVVGKGNLLAMLLK